MNGKSNIHPPSIPFQTLVNIVDAEDDENKKNRTPDLPLEIKSATTKQESWHLSSEF